MAESARNSGQVAAVASDPGAQSPDQPSIPIWQRQPNEPLVIYNRFKLFRNLGYKRTLLAALLKERETMQVLKGTDDLGKSGVERSESAKTARKRKGNATPTHLQEVPSPPPEQVPGSWKRASIKWHWVERAAAYDEYRIDTMVESSLSDLTEDAATVFHRVMLLKKLLEFMRVNLNDHATQMTYDQINAWIARMQSIMRDIREEMRHYDENVTRVLLRQQSTEVYRAYEPKTTKQLEQSFQSMLEQAGGDIDKVLLAIKKEEARRLQG